MRIAGLGGIIGNVNRPHRCSQLEYLGTLKQLLQSPPRSCMRGDIAVVHLRKAIELQQDFPHALDNMGIALPQLGQVREAEKYFTKAVAIALRVRGRSPKFGVRASSVGSSTLVNYTSLRRRYAATANAVAPNPSSASDDGSGTGAGAGALAPDTTKSEGP